MKFLVVYEDLWHNKESAMAEIGTLGTVIKEFVGDKTCEADYDKYNSDNPYDIGTFGPGFFDIDIYDGEEWERIMIFEISEC